MQTIWEGFIGALKLIFSMDPKTFQVVGLSIVVCFMSTSIASIIGIPIGLLLEIKTFPGKKIILRMVYTFMSIPPVIAGLFVYLILSRKGPLGALGLIYTPYAMIIAQVVLILPIVIGQMYAAARSRATRVLQLGHTLGANRVSTMFLLFNELKTGVFAAIIAAYGRAISEVGAVMIVGGNIEGHTRVMTTSIAMLQSMGRFDQAIALGIILLLISFIVQSALFFFQERNRA